MNLLNIKQGTPEWLAERVGRCTGSRVKDALSFLKNGESSAKRRGYMVDVVCERLIGYAAEHYVTPAMEWGLETEKFARAAYEVRTGNEVDRVGIAVHATIKDFMASPDGFVGEDGVWEAKCPTTAKHVEWTLAGEVPEEHLYQLWAELACSGRQWVDFVSFDPRVPARHQLFIKRLHRDEEQIAAMEIGVKQFLSEVDGMIAELERINPALVEAIRAQASPLPRTADGYVDLRRLADQLNGEATP